MPITRVARPPVSVLWKVDAAGALSACAYVLLLVLSRSKQDVHIAAFLGIMFTAWALLGLACTGKAPIPATRIWLWAIVFRIIGFFGQPVLEDDWYRYLWDGAVFATTGNPYDQPPGMFFGDPDVPPRLQPILDGINHPDVPTIYGPVCQVVFLISYWIAPGKLWPLKLMFIGADLVALGLLASMVKNIVARLFTYQRAAPGLLGWIVSNRLLLLYAWCPLLIKEVSFTAHPDILGIAFLIAALTVGRPRSVAIFCALAVGTKILAGLIAVLLLMRLPKRNWLTFGAVLAGLYFPFLVQGSFGDWAALRQFVGSWEFNSTLYGVMAIWMGTTAAKVICAALFLIFYVLYSWKWLRLADPHSAPRLCEALPRGDWVFGVFFLLSAVVNPWYLLWMLPFVAIFPTAAGITALVVISVAYAHGLNLPGSNLGPYDHPTWVRVVEVVTIFVAGSLPYLVPVRQTRA